MPAHLLLHVGAILLATAGAAHIDTISKGCILDLENEYLYMYDGEEISPGEEFYVRSGDYSCIVYKCGEDGVLTTRTEEYPPAMCMDPDETVCGYICINGDNCQLPSGDLLEAGKLSRGFSQKCECPEKQLEHVQNRTKAHYMAVCTEDDAKDYIELDYDYDY